MALPGLTITCKNCRSEYRAYFGFNKCPMCGGATAIKADELRKVINFDAFKNGKRTALRQKITDRILKDAKKLDW